MTNSRDLKSVRTTSAPSHVGAERAVLTTILSQGADMLLDLENTLTTDDFSAHHHQKLFTVLRDLVHSRGAREFDIPTILATAESLGYDPLTKPGCDHEYLDSLLMDTIGPDNARSLAGVIKKLSIARNAQRIVRTIDANLAHLTGNESAEAIIGCIENPIFDFTSNLFGAESGVSPIGQGYGKLIDVLAATPQRISGLPTGLNSYDEAIGGGLRPGTVNVVGARPKQGKSFLCLNVAHNVARSGIPVLYVDTELTKQHQIMRLASLVTGVETSRIETGQFSTRSSERQALLDAQEYIEKLPLTHCSIAGQPIRCMLSMIRRWLTKVVRLDAAGKANPCAVIYDYLKLTDAGSHKRNLAEYQALGFLLTDLHDFAVKYGIPIFATVQLNRDGEDREGGQVISGSDRILWLCSSFSILKRKSPKELTIDPSNSGDRKLVVTDTRFGPGMQPGQYLNLRTQLSRARIEEGPLFLGASSVPVNHAKVA